MKPTVNLQATKAQSIPFVSDFEPEFEYENIPAEPRQNSISPEAKTGALLIHPVTQGDAVTDFPLSRKAGVWQQLPSELFNAQSISLKELLNYKPLVISFYSPEWGKYSQQHLDLLDKSHQKITGLGAQLLVLTSVASDQIPFIIQTHGLQFNLVHDVKNRVAEQLGIYSSIYPLWKRIAGVNGEVPFPATFVIDTNGVIAYDFFSPDLTSFFDAWRVLSAIYEARNRKLSA